MLYFLRLLFPSNELSHHSNERMKAVKKLRKNPREVIKTIAPNHIVVSSIKDLPWPLKNRHFIYECVWTRKPDGSFVFAFQPPENEEDEIDCGLINLGINRNRQLLKAESRGFVIIKPTKEYNIDSCEVTWVQKLNGKGSIPPKIMERVIPRSLQLVSQVREKFCRDDDIDRIERENLMAIMQNATDKEKGEVYEESEMQLIDEVRKQMNFASDDDFRPLSR